MQSHIVSAVFDSRNEAERAIEELRRAGISNSSLSIIGQHDGETTETTGSGERVGDDDEPQSFLAKAAAGSGIGALLGVAALAIPGVGPLVAAGAIAESAIGGAALTGTVIGAAAGGLTDVLTKHGVSDEDASYYHDRLNQGGIFVSVDTSQERVSPDQAQDILFRSGGHNAGRAKASSTI